MSFTPQYIATDLVDKYRIILMNEDTDCGNECLCTIIAIKFAKEAIKERINEVESFKLIYDNISYSDKRINYLNDVISELDKL